MSEPNLDSSDKLNQNDLLASHLQFLFSVLQIQDADSIPSIIRKCNGNEREIINLVSSLITHKLMGNTVIVDDFSDDIEPNINDSTSDVVKSRFSGSLHHSASDTSFQSCINTSSVSKKPDFVVLHNYLDSLSCKDSNVNSIRLPASSFQDTSIPQSTDNQPQNSISSKNAISDASRRFSLFNEKDILSTFNQVQPEDYLQKSSTQSLHLPEENSPTTQNSDNEDILETYGYSLTSYIRNALNVFSTTSFIIDPSEKINKQGRVELKSFLILLLSRLLLIMEEGSERHKWQPDNTTTLCSLCNTPFSLLRRKHHCRICGRIYCSKCSSHTLPCSDGGKPERVCDICFILYSRIPNVNTLQ